MSNPTQRRKTIRAKVVFKGPGGVQDVEITDAASGVPITGVQKVEFVADATKEEMPVLRLTLIDFEIEAEGGTLWDLVKPGGKEKET